MNALQHYATLLGTLLGGSFGFNSYEPKPRRDVNRHFMITSPDAEIRMWNEEVARKRRERHKNRILRRMQAVTATNEAQAQG